MSKLKYFVTGIDNQTLGALVGTLIKGEIDGINELVCCPGNPQAYKVGPSGQVVEMPFDTLLTELVKKERARLKARVLNEQPAERTVQDIVSMGAMRMVRDIKVESA